MPRANTAYIKERRPIRLGMAEWCPKALYTKGFLTLAASCIARLRLKSMTSGMRNSLDLEGRPQDTRIVVAMSGGVDSSVTAALLKS